MNARWRTTTANMRRDVRRPAAARPGFVPLMARRGLKARAPRRDVELKTRLIALALLALVAAWALISARHASTPPPQAAPSQQQALAPFTPSAPMRAAPLPFFGGAGRLIIPVSGVEARALTDTWGQARSEGRHHEGIDIMAPMGSPVLAAAPGRVLKFFQSVRGGVTLYEADESGRVIFYYAHLMAYAPGLQEGAAVSQGQLLGFVGQSGNATTPHLHFEIQRAEQPNQWWHGQALNPYPMLIAHRLDPAL